MPAFVLRRASLLGLCGSLALVLAGGCTVNNPDYCLADPAGCPTGGEDGGGGAVDLRVPSGDDDLRTGGDDLRVEQGDMRPACLEDSECASRICLPGGTCQNGGSVVYVNNRNGACTGTHAGTLADPVCTTGQGLDLLAASGRQYMVLLPSSHTYDAMQIEGRTVYMVGPGAFASPGAQVNASVGRAALRLSGGAQVSAKGIEFTGGNEVIVCQGSVAAGAALVLDQVSLHDGLTGAAGVSRCKLSLSRSVAYNNGRGIAAESGSTVAVDNSFLLYNRGAALRMSDGTLRVRFSTLVGNGSFNTSGAADCGGAVSGRTIEASILVDNTRPNNGSQLTGNCRLLSSAIDENAYANGNNNRFGADPTFVSNLDYHLQRSSRSTACCIDQLDSSALTSDVVIDYDGTARPQGARWDIGAHEVK